MRGSHSPVGWAATMLIAVAYAHVLLELAAPGWRYRSRSDWWLRRRVMRCATAPAAAAFRRGGGSTRS
jgi:hypothetical protein